MAMVGVVAGSLYRRTHSLSRLLGLGSAAAWRHSTFIKWTGWTIAMALPWWQHHKQCHGYYYYYPLGTPFFQTLKKVQNLRKTKNITRTATTSMTFAVSWICHCCLPPTSRLVCKRFVRPSAMTCRWLGKYSSWWSTFNVNGSTPIGNVTTSTYMYSSARRSLFDLEYLFRNNVR